MAKKMQKATSNQSTHVAGVAPEGQPEEGLARGDGGVEKRALRSERWRRPECAPKWAKGQTWTKFGESRPHVVKHEQIGQTDMSGT